MLGNKLYVWQIRGHATLVLTEGTSGEGIEMKTTRALPVNQRGAVKKVPW